MMTTRLYGVAATALLALLSAAGCCDKEKQEIAKLTQEYNDCSMQNKSLRQDWYFCSMMV